MKKTYKLIADTNNGVTLVDSFDDFHGIEIIDEMEEKQGGYNPFWEIEE